MKYLLKTTALIYMLLFISCGYRTPEADKHPEIPIFPMHTNNQLYIKQITPNLYGIKCNEKYLFAHNSDGELVIIDRHFYTTKTIQASNNYISKNGDIYSIELNKNPELTEVYKISVLNNFKKEKIENLIINSREGYAIRDSLNLVYNMDMDAKENIESKRRIDSLIPIIYQKEQDVIAAKLEELKPNVISIYPLAYSVSVLKFKNKELALYTRNDHSQNFKAMLEETRSNELEFIWDVTKSPKSFDKVVLGNSFSGNHYVGGYTPYGYNYIELSLDKQTTKFKAKNTHNGDGVHILHESKDTVILTDYEKLYRVTLKP